MMEKTKKVVSKKLLITVGVLLSGLAIVIFYFFVNGSSNAIKFAEVKEKIPFGDLTLSGEVSTTQIVEMKPKASGVIDAIHIQEGDSVKKGQLAIGLFSSKQMIDVETAKLRLASAENDLAQLWEPPDEIDVKKSTNAIVKAENALAQLTSTYNIAHQNYLDILEDLEKDIIYEYDGTFNDLVNIFPDLPGLLAAMDDLIVNNDKNLDGYINLVGWPESIPKQRNKIKDSYADAKASYKAALTLYRETSRDDIEALPLLIKSTQEAVYDMSQVLEGLDIFWAMLYDRIDTSSDYFTSLEEHQTTTATHIATITSYSSLISDDLERIDDLYDLIEDANIDIANLTETYELDKYELELIVEEKQLALDDIKLGTDELDITRQELEVEQKSNSLRTAQESLDDMFLYAPFNGYVANINGELGETVATSTNVLTIISDVKLIELTINELDMADVEIGQSAVVSFDAISDLDVNASIISIDILGKSEQGIISYGAILTLEADDPRIKSGMNVEAKIITKDADPVLVIPITSLKKNTDGSYYVDLLVERNSMENKTEKRKVQIGKEDSTMVEIVFGLKAGDLVLDQKTNST